MNLGIITSGIKNLNNEEILDLDYSPINKSPRKLKIDCKQIGPYISDIKLCPFKSKTCQLSVLQPNFFILFDEPFQKPATQIALEQYSQNILIREKTEYELIDSYTDNYPLLLLRKSIFRLKILVSELCSILIQNPYFEFLVILVILMNTFILAISTDLNNDASSIFEEFFLIFYTVECLMKIFSYGFIIPKHSYLRDSWNVLDFVIVISAWIDNIFRNSVNLQAVRIIRVLRPLRSISSIAGLRVIFIALVNSVKPLLAAFTLFLFLIIIFAIAGLQLWSGLLKYRCMDLDTGVVDVDKICGGASCPKGSDCVKTLNNPNYGITNFDNFLFSALTIYQCITLEGWTGVMIFTQKAFNDFSIILFIPLVFIGAFILVNLTLAIIKSAFSKSILQASSKPKHTEENVEVRTLIKHLSDSQIQKSSSIKRENSIESFLNNSNMPMIVEKNLNNNEEDFPEHINRELPKNPDLLNGESYLTPIETRDRGGAMSRSINSQLESKLKKGLRRSFYNDEEMVNHITELLSRINNTVKVDKKALEKIKLGDKFDKTTINISSYTVSIRSKRDILPQIITEKTTVGQNWQTYTFSYKDNKDPTDFFILQSRRNREILMYRYFKTRSEFLAFCLLVKKFSNDQAFEMLNTKVSEIVIKVRNSDECLNIVKGDWSGQDVSEFSNFEKKDFSHFNYFLWASGLRGYYQKLTYPLLWLISQYFFSIFMTFCIIFNTVVLSLDHYGISSEMNSVLLVLNNIFINIFIAEMGLKLLGMGLVAYFRDFMNYFDGIVVILSIIENIYLNRSKSAFTAFRVVRIFRILRVLRVARLFRYLKSMTHILQSLGKSMSKFIYLFLLLMLFLCIYSLVGLQIFSGKFTFNGVTSRGNFDGFHWSFTTTFQILSVENWQLVLWDGMRSSAGYSSCIFFISWIFIGNYVILNLFLAILLDSFSEKTDDVVTEQSISLFTNTKMKKKREEKIKIIQNLNSESEDETGITSTERELFNEANFEGNSFFLFSVQNPFRKICIRIFQSNKFEVFIMVIISCTSLKLAIDTYLMNSNDIVLALTFVDMGFTLFFLIEFIIKSVSLGFWFGQKSYLKDYWNHIDFIIVVLSIIDFSVSSVNISQIKIIRLLRTLRPLRYISHNLSMKIVVTALLESLIAIMNVAVVLLLVWLMFAILGFSLFAGKLYTCSYSLILNETDCIAAGYLWESIYPNYDNVFNAMITLFILSSEEDWPEIMDTAIDGKDIGVAPEKNYNQYSTYYFIVFIMLSSFFFMNLFTAVVFEKFIEAKNNQSSLAASILTKEQMVWIELQQLIVKSTPSIDFSSKPEHPFRALMYNLSKNIWFKMVILLTIVLNMIQMALMYDEASPEYLEILDAMNLLFTSCFIMEACIKMIGLGVVNYMKSGSNKFDFFVVITSIIDIILFYATNSTVSLLRLGPQLIRIIRVLRVSRLVRLFKSLSMLKNLIDVIGYSLPAIMNVMSLLILVFFIYAVLGVNLFYTVNSGIIINEHVNFHNFGYAMLTLFRCSTGEDWYKIMKDCSPAQNTVVSYIFFISFITITTFIMLNLFIMVIIQNYEQHEGNPESVTRIFSKEIKKIKMFWSIYAKDTNGIRLHFNELAPMLQEMEELGVNQDMSLDQIIKILSIAELHPDQSGFVYYNDFLFAVLRKKYFKRSNNLYFRKILVNEENKTKKMLSKIIKKEKSKLDQRSPLHGQNFGNLFMTTLFLRSVIRGWKNYTVNKRMKKNGSVSITPRFSEYEDPGCNSFNSEA